MGAEAHVNANVVKHGGDLQQQSCAIAETVLLTKLVEDSGRERGDVMSVLAIPSITLSEPLGACKHLPFEVLDVHPTSGISEVQERTSPQRRARHDYLADGGLRQQRPVDEQRRAECLRLDGRKSKPLDDAVLGQPLHLVAESQESLARDLVMAVVRFLFLHLRGQKADISAERNHVREPIERNLETDLIDDVRDVPTQQGRLNLLAMPSEIQLLAEPNRSECVHARAVRF